MGKVKCADCKHLRRLSEDKNRWSFEQSTCTVRKNYLGLPVTRWPAVPRLCGEFKEAKGD